MLEDQLFMQPDDQQDQEPDQEHQEEHQEEMDLQLSLSVLLPSFTSLGNSSCNQGQAFEETVGQDNQVNEKSIGLVNFIEDGQEVQDPVAQEVHDHQLVLALPALPQQNEQPQGEDLNHAAPNNNGDNGALEGGNKDMAL